MKKRLTTPVLKAGLHCGVGHEHDVVCTRMLDSLDMEVFTLEAVREETENNTEKKKKM
jgi:hypothetical protein